MSYDLYSDFDIEQHKKHYVNYLEVVLFPDGHIEYAVPSHQEKLIKICCKQLNISRQELFIMCPPDYYCDVIVWMCNISGCVSIWNNYLIQSDKNELTPEQISMLQQLKQHKLYSGSWR